MLKSKARRLFFKQFQQQQQLEQQGEQQQQSTTTTTPTKQEYFDFKQCHRTYSCAHCRAHLADHDQLVSKLFQGNHGRAYLFNKVVNIGCKQAVQRELLTGLHAVADIYCDNCETTLGWKYEQAFVPSQKYKEGKYIIELVHMLKENNWDLTSYNARELIREASGQEETPAVVHSIAANVGQYHRRGRATKSNDVGLRRPSSLGEPTSTQLVRAAAAPQSDTTTDGQASSSSETRPQLNAPVDDRPRPAAVAIGDQQQQQQRRRQHVIDMVASDGETVVINVVAARATDADQINNQPPNGGCKANAYNNNLSESVEIDVENFTGTKHKLDKEDASIELLERSVNMVEGATTRIIRDKATSGASLNIRQVDHGRQHQSHNDSASSKDSLCSSSEPSSSSPATTEGTMATLGAARDDAESPSSRSDCSALESQ